MKNSFFKAALPVVVAVMGLAGAFTTMSMQDASAGLAPVTGWVTDHNMIPCNLQVQCSDTGGPKCTFNGEIARVKNGTQCTTDLFRLVP